MPPSDSEPTLPAASPPVPAFIAAMPRHVAEQLRGYIEAVGITMPSDLGLLVPEVRINPIVREMAQEVGCFLSQAPIYLQNGEMVTVDETTGITEPMDADTFSGWVDQWISFYKLKKAGTNETGQAVYLKEYESISPQRAKVLMKQHNLKSQIKVLRAVHQVKLPTCDFVEGEYKPGSFRLLPCGYDKATQTFTCKGLDYREDMPWQEAVQTLWDLFQHFPWGDSKRSYAVHLAYYLSVFGGALVPPMCRSPLFFYNANAVGSGKSQLGRLPLWWVHGRADLKFIDENQSEFKKTLDAEAQTNSPFQFFDDLTGYLENNLLNAWMTGPMWGGRVFGVNNKTFRAELRTTVCVTGNKLKLSKDLGRRTLLVDLFMEENIKDRILPEGAVEITDEWALQPSVRALYLSCLHALLRDNFSEEGEKLRAMALKQMTPLASFQSWSRSIVPAVMAAVPGGNPLEDPKLPDAGDVETDDETRTLAKAVEMFGDGKDSFEVSLPQFAAAARTCNAFFFQLGSIEDSTRELDERKEWPKADFTKTGWARDAFEELVESATTEHRQPENDKERAWVAASFLNPRQNSAFGKRIKRALAMKFWTGEGENRVAWRFGKREDTKLSTFTIKKYETK